MLDEEKIEEVDNFVYLGSVIDTSSKSSKEIYKRLTMATVQNMLNIWKSRGVSTKLKLRLLQATAFAVVHQAAHQFIRLLTEKGGMLW